MPYAGGSSVVFSKWPAYLDKTIELVPIELAGRRNRLLEPLYDDYQEMVDDIVSMLKSNIDSEYAIFGHSLGGYAAYDVFNTLKANSLPLPQHVFFSGVAVPHLMETEKKYRGMSEEEFIKILKEFGGTPPEFFEYPELLEVFLPVLRSDFGLLETRDHTHNTTPLNIDITVFLGKDEPLTPKQCDGWKNYSDKIVTICYFEGGHFFLNSELDKMIQIINKNLK